MEIGHATAAEFSVSIECGVDGNAAGNCHRAPTARAINVAQSGLAPTLGHGNSFLFSIGAGFRARDFINRMRSEGAGPQGDCCDQIPKKRLPVTIQGIGR